MLSLCLLGNLLTPMDLSNTQMRSMKGRLMEQRNFSSLKKFVPMKMKTTLT